MVVLAMAAAASLCCVGIYLYYVLWLLPERIRGELRRQGVGGPRPSFPYGNLADMHAAAAAKSTGGEQRDAGAAIVHDYRQAIFPSYEKWRKQHGPVFTYSVGNMVFLHISRPDLVRELSLCVSLHLGKSSYMKATHQPLFGDGILKSNGHAWAHQRKLIAPEFFPNKVKGIVDRMVESAQALVIKSWQDRLDDRSDGNALDIMIDDDIRAYSADVISRTCFGSSYDKGKEIFDMIRELQKIVSKKPKHQLAEMAGLSFLFPLSTSSSRAAWRLSRRVRALILDLVGECGKKDDGGGGGDNLLSALLRSAGGSNGDGGVAATEDFVVDNCKNIYFAGYESTAVTAAWCLMLLALHPEWQRRVRHEVQEVGRGALLNFPALQKMKNLTMVIQETLRLYPAGAVVSRQALRDLTIGGELRVPKGINIYIPVSTLHLDEDLWGGGAAEFDPARFAAADTKPPPPHYAYLPFGTGARTCLGQAFAMAELKVLLALVLSRFEVALSPEYVHSPALRLIVEPEHGVRLVLRNAINFLAEKGKETDRLSLNKPPPRPPAARVALRCYKRRDPRLASPRTRRASSDPIKKLAKNGRRPASPDRRGGGGGEAVAGQGAVAVVPPPERQPERGAPPPGVRPVRPQRRRRDHRRRAGAGARRARSRGRPRRPRRQRRRLRPRRRGGSPVRGLRGAPPRPRRRAVRRGGHARGRRRRRRGRGGDEGGVQGVRRRRRRVHLRRRAADGAQEARDAGGRQPRHRQGDDLQRRPRQRRPRRLRRVQVHDAGDHRLWRLITYLHAAMPRSPSLPSF